MNQTAEMTNLFQFELYDFDLPEGLIQGPGRHRVCVLSSDMIKGIHKSLVEEAGEAWGLVFKRCGRLWGTRLSERLDQVGTELRGVPLGRMPLQDFVRFVEEYFLFNGWGALAFDFRHAATRGVVEAKLDHSLFAEVLEGTKGRLHPMICGILGSLFSHLSGQDLDCLETDAVPGSKWGARFVITARSRVEPFENAISLPTHDKVVETI